VIAVFIKKEFKKKRTLKCCLKSLGNSLVKSCGNPVKYYCEKYDIKNKPELPLLFLWYCFQETDESSGDTVLE